MGGAVEMYVGKVCERREGLSGFAVKEMGKYDRLSGRLSERVSNQGHGEELRGRKKRPLLVVHVVEF